MPLDNIKRAILKGTGELPGHSYESVTYEGYGPGGVAVILDVLTDNKNRTVAEIRHLFSKAGGNLGEAGSVKRMFERKGYVVVSKEQADEERLLEIVLDAGAEDLRSEGESFEVYTSFETFAAVKNAIAATGIEVHSGEITMVPLSSVHVDGKKAEQMLKLMEALEDHDDVQNVYANFDIDEAEMEAIVNA
jgi:YebC/PmpR family DNA-binding regulatory protein